MFSFLEQLLRLLEYPLLKIGAAQLTPWTIIQFFILLILVFALAGRIKNLLLNKVLHRSNLDTGVQHAIATMARYLVLVIGSIIVLQTLGIDLTALNVLAGAIGVGIGFGMQNIANNFISGLIILFERPIKIGDRIEVGQIEGDVVEIGARSTTILTNDNISIIVPNSSFISENIINWKYRDPMVRFRVPVSVAYGSDVNQVKKLLLEVAFENSHVLKDPEPDVFFREFGDNGLQFELLVWSTTLVHRKNALISYLNFAIYEKFNQHQIEIPFPQNDVHIRSGILEVKNLSTPLYER